MIDWLQLKTGYLSVLYLDKFATDNIVFVARQK